MSLKTFSVFFLTLLLIKIPFKADCQQLILGYDFNKHYNYFNQIKRNVIKNVIMLNSIMNNIKNKQQFEAKSSEIKRILNSNIIYAIRFKNKFYSIPAKWRFNFILWFGYKFPVLSQYFFLIRMEAYRIMRIPGCKKIFTNIRNNFFNRVFN